MTNWNDHPTIEALLTDLRTNDVVLTAREDRLIIDAPAGTVSAELRRQIAERKEEILEFIRTAGTTASANIRPTGGDGPKPLSFAQERMWFLDQLQDRSAAFNTPVQVRFSGPLNVDALRKSLDEILRRHEILRTNFPLVDGKPVPVVRPPGVCDMELIDCSTWIEEERKRFIQQRIQEGAETPFDLAADPLVRVTLLRCEPEAHLLLLTTHHIVSDGWSMGILFNELSRLYEACDQGRTHPSPESDLQYTDYARWQRRALADGKMEPDLEYWREVLEGAPDRLELPTDRPRPVVYRYEGGKVPFTVGSSVAAALKKLGEQENATLFMTLLAAYAALLSRVTGVRDVVVGYPIAGRRRQELESVIGCFVNTLMLRCDLSDDPTFRQLVARVRAAAAEAYEHQDLPFEKLVEALQPERDLGHNPLFQVAFLFQNVPVDAPEMAGMELLPRGEHQFTPGATFDVTLVMYEAGEEGLQGELEYNRTLFDHTTAERFAAMFQTLLAAAVREPEKPVLEVEILDPTTREHLLFTCNDTNASYPKLETVSTLFERQVEETPDDVAAVCGGDTVTYRELNARANRMGRLLQTRGIGRGSIVGVMLDRSIDLFVALLGIMKSGAAYLPLDVSYPDGRIRTILEDSGVQTLVTRLETSSGCAGLAAFEGSLVDVSDSDASSCEAGNLDCRIDSSDPVYVIYTSGSTGKPKGVVVEHGGLTNYIWWAKKQYLGGDRLDFPLYTSLAFDLTVTSLYLPLVSGGRVIIYPESSDSRVPTVLQVVHDRTADIVKLTPAHLALIKDLDMKDARIRKLIVGGEDLKTDLARRIHDVFGGNVKIYNEYGPTEAVVGCMIHRYDPKNDTAASVPIGRPADNCRVYLLDDHRHPVPPGAIGEMYISGDGVARGYLNREDLTRQSFLPDPFVPGARMYRTGDLARWRNEGVMEYCGRIDHQVKIRGIRVELGEIEAELRAHDGVRACVVDLARRKAVVLSEDELQYCTACGLASNYPGTTYDEQGRCNQCIAYEQYRKTVEPYFRDMDELEAILEAARGKKRGEYDCIALLSGGKDSTYVLARLVEMGFRVLAYTLDNGYISEQAKENIRRVVSALDVDHIFGTTPHMNAIFADSLARHSNVCNGCFKTLYTLSIHLARERGIPCIVTGLSRGQQFETRLSNFYRSDDFRPEAVDCFIKEARKVYHRLDDEVSRRLDVGVFEEDGIFDEIEIIDFYRYSDVSLDELYAHLDARLPWVRPSDTGRSTNCLINDVGIYIHKKERRYHNYAMPYAWDVRMGHKQRDAALEELNDQIDTSEVRRILGEIRYDEKNREQQYEPVLTAYYVSDGSTTADDLRSYLADRLPDAMIPSVFAPIDEVPINRNGKVDRSALAALVAAPAGVDLEYLAPRSTVEQRLVSIWSEVLGLDRVGIRDNFFRLGGHSLLAAQVASRIAQDLQVELHVAVLFERTTVEELALAVAECQTGQRVDDAELDDILSEVEAMTNEEAKGQLHLPDGQNVRSD